MENKTPYLKIHHELECSFINFFESKGYQRLAPVPISSHVLGKQCKPVQVHSFSRFSLRYNLRKFACWGSIPNPL